METCCICLENDSFLITPKHCSCKVYLHEECYNKIINYNIYCPICRINPIIKPNSQYNYNNYIVQLADSIFKYPLMVFNRFPNIFSFLFCIISSVIIFTFFITPLFLLEKIRYKTNIFVDLIIIGSVILYYY